MSGVGRFTPASPHPHVLISVCTCKINSVDPPLHQHDHTGPDYSTMLSPAFWRGGIDASSGGGGMSHGVRFFRLGCGVCTHWVLYAHLRIDSDPRIPRFCLTPFLYNNTRTALAQQRGAGGDRGAVSRLFRPRAAGPGQQSPHPAAIPHELRPRRHSARALGGRGGRSWWEWEWE